MQPTAPDTATVETVTSGGRTVLRVAGRLDVASTPRLWAATSRRAEPPSEVDVSGVDGCDSAGAAWLISLRAPVSGASPKLAELLELLTPRPAQTASPPPAPDPAAPPEEEEFVEDVVEDVGGKTAEYLAHARATVAYVGTLIEGVGIVIRRPSALRRKDLLVYMARTGSEALPIVALIAFLVGVIIAFQAAEQLKQFGATLYVADAVAVSIVMELGPLMTAIIMAGRSGSAFAAEIGTMKVNEEVDALDTMGLDSTRFLVMPKFIALCLTMPLLVTFASFAGIAGGLVIGVTTLDLPMGLYLNQSVNRLTIWQISQGYIKAECYAVVIAAIGCLRGLQTKAGAQGVGLSATSAVVSGIFMIIVVDAVLTVLFSFV